MQIIRKKTVNHPFYLENGDKIENLDELVKNLRSMSDEQFEKYVSAGKNDFSLWIRNSLHDEKLAEEIKDKQQRSELSEVLENHLRKRRINNALLIGSGALIGAAISSGIAYFVNQKQKEDLVLTRYSGC